MKKPVRFKAFPVFRWSDFFIGFFFNRKPTTSVLYIYPLPMFGIRIEWGCLPRKTYVCDPVKNTECSKAICFINGNGDCRMTLDKKFELKVRK